MSLENAKKHIQKYNLEDRIMIFNDSLKTVKEAAEVLNCEEKEIAKSLTFLLNEEPILIVTSGDKKIDNAKYKNEFGLKAKMIPREEVEEIIGHPAGGVCPFGIKDNVKVFLDISLKEFNYVYPACGSHTSVIKLSLKELEELSNYIKWVDVCKD